MLNLGGMRVDAAASQLIQGMMESGCSVNVFDNWPMIAYVNGQAVVAGGLMAGFVAPAPSTDGLTAAVFSPRRKASRASQRRNGGGPM